MSESSRRRAGPRVFAWAARVLGRVESRLVLSAAIIVSLLPFDWVPGFDGLFLAMFAVEFGLRALLIFRGENLYAHGSATGVTPTPAEIEGARRWAWPSTGTMVLLVCDLLALLSFVPSLVGLDAAETRWLRLFRLSRMLLLLSYWAPLVRDVWSVMLKRERARQVVLMGFVVLALTFAGAVVIDQMRDVDDVIDFDDDGVAGYDEAGRPLDPDDERFYVHLWWAFRQIQDPGNMLASPEQAVAVIVSLALTVAGLFLVSFLIGLGTDVVRELMELSRLRPPGLRGHTIVVNIDLSTQRLLHELLRYSRKLLPEGRISLRWVAQLLRNTQRGIRGARYVVVGRGHDPPDFLRLPDLASVTYRQAHVEDETFLARTDVAHAQRVVLLADLEVGDPDAATIQALLTITGSLREADDETRRRDSLFGTSTASKRARLLIAEILDESNVPAARAAIVDGPDASGSGPRTRAYVIPSERLIALFIACVARRPGVGRLLDELLSSHGHELYTLFFNQDGLGYRRADREPELPGDPHEIMAELIRRSRSLGSRRRLVPVGVLMAGDGDDEVRVVINPKLDADLRPTQPEMPEPGELADDASRDPAITQTDARRCLGFVAIADNFGRVRELADDLYARAGEQVPAGPDGGPSLPAFAPAPTNPLERVLVCGFRSGTVGMVEALIQAQPRARILVMVQDEAARARAWDDFDAHTKLVERGLLTGHHGVFFADEQRWALSWRGPDGAASGFDHVHIVVGDWSSSRQLSALPHEFGHVATMSAVILISDGRPRSDARTAKTLMKLETLTSGPRVVAEVVDVELARRLRRRGLKGTAGSDDPRGGAKKDTPRVTVYSIQELRAFFMFQSIVVPSFDLVYAELMGPWGQSFVRLELDADAPLEQTTCSFEELADHLAQTGRVLVAVELCTHDDEQQVRLHVAAGDGGDGDVDLTRVTGIWVIA